MPLSGHTRRYLLQTSNGRLLLGNALALIRMGLITSDEAIDLFQQAHSEACKVAAGIPDALQFEDQLKFARDSMLLGLGKGSPMIPLVDTPNLAGQNLYSVMPLRYLHHLVPGRAKLRNIVDLPVDTEPSDPEGFIQSWADTTKEHRRFDLAVVWGRPIIWITNQTAVDRARAASRPAGQTDADLFTQTLGLGHYEVDQMAVLITIPGSVVQKAGHYRPTFADAVRHRFFMARSSRPRARIGNWGQTAHLAKLTASPYDGGAERVSLPITPSHFHPHQKLEVLLLEKVTTNRFIPNQAPPELAEGVWRRRRG